MNILQDMSQKCELWDQKHSVVHCVRVGNKPGHKLGKFLFMEKNCWKENRMELMKSALDKYIVEGCQVEEQGSFVQHLPEMPTETLEDQLNILQSIPNFHWWDCVQVSGKTKQTGKRPEVRLASHLLYSPSEVQNEEGDIVSKYIPTSPRNRLMYFVKSGNQFTLRATISKLLGGDKCDEPMVADVCETPQEVDLQIPVPKKRRMAARVMHLDRMDISEELGVDLNSLLNFEGAERSLYGNFREQLITDGLIQWRQHDDNQEIVVMSDYDGSTGVMIPSSFVHVSLTRSEEGTLLLKCQCAAYKLLEKAALHRYNLVPGEEGFLADNLSCMHCRFYKEQLLHIQENIAQSDDLSLLQEKVVEGLQVMNDPLVLLGNPVPSGATKYSVKGGGTFALMTITFTQGICFAKCHNGSCQAQGLNKKKIPKNFTLAKLGKHSEKLCEHMSTLYHSFDQVKAHLPEKFQGEEDGGQGPGDTDVENTDDVQVRCRKATFNADTGLWQFPSWSTHIPHQMRDPELIRCVNKFRALCSLHSYSSA